jgi:hypothetical protein
MTLFFPIRGGISLSRRSTATRSQNGPSTLTSPSKTLSLSLSLFGRYLFWGRLQSRQFALLLCQKRDEH